MIANVFQAPKQDILDYLAYGKSSVAWFTFGFTATSMTVPMVSRPSILLHSNQLNLPLKQPSELLPIEGTMNKHITLPQTLQDVYLELRREKEENAALKQLVGRLVAEHNKLAVAVAGLAECCHPVCFIFFPLHVTYCSLNAHISGFSSARYLPCSPLYPNEPNGRISFVIHHTFGALLRLHDMKIRITPGMFAMSAMAGGISPSADDSLRRSQHYQGR